MNNETLTSPYPHKITTAYIQEIFHDCSDLLIRRLRIGGCQELFVPCIRMDGLTAGADVSEDIFRPLTDPLRFGHCQSLSDAFSALTTGAVYNHQVKVLTQTADVVGELLSGSVVLIFDCLHQAIAFEARSAVMRSVDQPTLEKSVKGSKEAFIENIRVNSCLVRRKLKTPRLKNLSLTVGRKSDTAVSILYIEGVAKFETVQKLQKQLEYIQIDGLLDAGYLEQYAVDAPRSPFPQMLHTERSDTFASMLLDGQVGILIDGIPVGFLVPAPLSRFLQVSEDKAQHFAVASMLMLLRYAALVIGLLLPGLYVAVAMYHQEMIPTELLTSVISAKQQVPFSTAMEVIGMLIAFELLQEAGLRLPNPVGDTVSIIGALIVGQAAVDARVVSPIAVIIVAFSGISSYTLPSQDLASAIRVLRPAIVLAATAAGLFGVMALSTLLLWHLCTIDTYGLAYLHPFADGSSGNWLRSILRKPLWADRFRDKKIAGDDLRRQV